MAFLDLKPSFCKLFNVGPPECTRVRSECWTRLNIGRALLTPLIIITIDLMIPTIFKKTYYLMEGLLKSKELRHNMPFQILFYYNDGRKSISEFQKFIFHYREYHLTVIYAFLNLVSSILKTCKITFLNNS